MRTLSIPRIYQIALLTKAYKQLPTSLSLPRLLCFLTSFS